jgi:ATP synthase protein I
MQNLDFGRAKRILLIQCVLTLVLAGAGTLYNEAAGLSALLGGVITTAANGLFAVVVFGRYRAQEAGKLVFRFYGAELLKLGFVLLMFAATFIWVGPAALNLVALFGAFFLVQVLPPLLPHSTDG